ncbi:MAG TPA: EamA family transporter, partial [Clostridia bacterium]|nr:EamA family transporter [Clostridia bacterium]
ISGIGQAAIPILYGGLLSVGVAYTLQVVAQKHAKPSHAAIILSMESVFAALGGALLLGENLGGRGYLGCALMFAGMLLTQVNIFEKKESAEYKA